MAKINHNNFLDTVNEVFTDAKQEGVIFLGRTICINNRQLFHFGTTGYLGLEQNARLKTTAIDAITPWNLCAF